MAEALNLSTPDQVKPGTTKYQIRGLQFERGVSWDPGTSAFVVTPADSAIFIDLIGEGDIVRRESYTGAEAETLMKQLNTVNLATKSLHKRVMERLITDGRLGGTIAGTPDT